MKESGFTLIELIVVMAIIGILVMLSMPKYLEYQKDARLTKIIVQTKELEKACEKYYMINNDWPRLSDEPYSAAEVTTFGEKILASTGKVVELDENGNYYDINYIGLDNYLRAPRDKENYILQNPIGVIYYLDGINDNGKLRVEDKDRISSVTFTTAGVVGPKGPTQEQLESEYQDTSLSGKVLSIGGIQEWVVPKSGQYRLDVSGASGLGKGCGGAILGGDFNLVKGEKLRILVGQLGTDASGGGGTFVTKVRGFSEYIMFDGVYVEPLIIAGGGGGGNSSRATTHSNGVSTTYALGGTNGSGGHQGYYVEGLWNGTAFHYGSFGGGGFKSNGIGAEGGVSFLSGGVGYSGGAFGGGTPKVSYGIGTSRYLPYGSGGGYSGGGGATHYNSGGGGGSFISSSSNNIGTSDGKYSNITQFNGSMILNLSEWNTSHGKVVITFIGD